MKRLILALATATALVGCGDDSSGGDEHAGHDHGSVPDSYRELMAPDAESVAHVDADDVFRSRCAGCHEAEDAPVRGPDLTAASTTERSDGYLFWRIREGGGGMPAFEMLDEETIWARIHHFRAG